MMKTIIHIDGMACGMCEAHINNAIRKEFDIKKISSSHSKKMTEVISENQLDEEKVKKIIIDAGYTFISMDSGEYKKKGLFSFLKK